MHMLIKFEGLELMEAVMNRSIYAFSAKLGKINCIKSDDMER